MEQKDNFLNQKDKLPRIPPLYLCVVMKKTGYMQRTVIAEIMTASLIVLFVYASLSKLLAYPVFVTQLHQHPLLKHFAGFIAWALPVVELIVAALLVIPRTRLKGLYSAAALLVIFTAYLGLMLLTEKDLPCSCGGVIGSLTWGQHIVFNGVFIVLAVMGIRLAKPQRLGKSARLAKQKPAVGESVPG